MELSFVNRTAELKELDAAAAAGGLMVFFGRRRVGKTRLLAHWLARHGGLYSQAIESASDIQLDQTYRDLQPQLTTTDGCATNPVLRAKDLLQKPGSGVDDYINGKALTLQVRCRLTIERGPCLGDVDTKWSPSSYRSQTSR